MQVILLKDKENLGSKHEVVTVKPGYGRNFLIPQKIAIVANDVNMAKLDEIKKKEEEKRQEMLDVYRDIQQKLGTTVLKIGAKAGNEGKIFGSVTNIQIAQAIKEQLSEEVDRKLIELDEEVKSLGAYTGKIHFDPDVIANVNFEVVQD
jgi:large subunit ribosomal protein L9